ncbi:hypothetical protein H7F33_14930 [Pedobacter sp. PAMC26386]|nr:hypothetical protein H7F33_14930 [Pedobacter sp. PAMC26386]
MAILTNSILGSFKGKIGNITIYPLGNQTVGRGIGISHKKPTTEQLTTRLVMKKMNKFFQHIGAMIRIGFELEARGTNQNEFNKAMTQNFNQFTGKYPDIAIDFAKVLVTKGKMAVIKEAKAEKVTNGLKLTWDTEIAGAGMHKNDQVLVLAYFPDGKTIKARIFTSEVRRFEGKYTFKLDRNRTMKNAHIYLSFISNNCKIISDSVYLGEISWGNVIKKNSVK